MKAIVFAAAVVLTGCNSCQPTVSPPTTATDQAVYDALVDAGCLGPSDGGVAAVAAEHAGPNPAWLNCMYNMGTVAGCQVPCSR